MNKKRVFSILVLMTLISIYLVILAGGIVRVTGSGMGCPDWPKCFGQWIPPTSVSELPPDYRDIFLEKRLNKLDKFTSLLTSLGFEELSNEVRNDPNVKTEEVFSAQKTWIEYINRLFGFLAGNIMLLTWVFSLFLIKEDKWLSILTFLALILTGFQAWFGSIVVTTNLLQWTISVHLFLALIIVLLLVTVYWRVYKPRIRTNVFTKRLYGLLFIISLVQFSLGSEVRKTLESSLQIYSREEVIDHLGMVFLIHRSFSWLFIIGMGLLLFSKKIRRENDIFEIVVVIFIIFELMVGVFMSFLEIPAFLQPLHLLGAFMLISALHYRYKSLIIN